MIMEKEMSKKMTLKEVKETLQTWIATADDEYDREEMGRVCGLKEALHEINKIDVCEDAISRQWAIEAAEKGCLELKGVFERVKDNLKALPSANVCTDAISRQEAIKTIENEQKKIMRSDWAIDQAKFSAMSEIRALIEELPSVSMEKPKKCGDLISRQEAIEWMGNIRELNRYYHPKGNDDKTLVSEVIDRLKQLPSVSTEKPNRWIPVSERLPENGCFVIVTIKDESGDSLYLYSDFGWYLDKAACWIIDAEQRTDIIAWMSLPEPYKAESEDGYEVY